MNEVLGAGQPSFYSSFTSYRNKAVVTVGVVAGIAVLAFMLYRARTAAVPVDQRSFTMRGLKEVSTENAGAFRTGRTLKELGSSQPDVITRATPSAERSAVAATRLPEQMTVTPPPPAAPMVGEPKLPEPAVAASGSPAVAEQAPTTVPAEAIDKTKGPFYHRCGPGGPRRTHGHHRAHHGHHGHHKGRVKEAATPVDGQVAKPTTAGGSERIEKAQGRFIRHRGEPRRGHDQNAARSHHRHPRSASERSVASQCDTARMEKTALKTLGKGRGKDSRSAEMLSGLRIAKNAKGGHWHHHRHHG